MISPALAKQLKLDYLHTMSMNELAHWLIHSFTPARYYNKNDVIKEACLLLCEQAGCKFGGELITKLWAMHGIEPPSNIIEFKRNKDTVWVLLKMDRE